MRHTRREVKGKAAKTLVIGAIAIFMAGALSGCGSKKANLNDYITITCEGYDGMGTATASFDYEAFEEDYEDKVKITNAGKKNDNFMEEYEYWYEGDIIYMITDCIYGSLDNKYDLSNGDTITYEWDNELSSIEDYVNIKFTCSDIEYTVSELEEIKETDIFENVTVEFSGTAPYAEASISVSGDLSESYFSIEPDSGLDIGDTVTVSIDDDYAEEIIYATGMIPAEYSKEYVVEDVAYYVSSLDDIPDDAMTKMESQAQDEFDSYVASNWDQTVTTLSSFTKLGCYFLNAKDTLIYGDQNDIILVYEYHANQMGEDVTGYWYCNFYDGIMLRDGTYSMDYNDYTVPTGGLFNFNSETFSYISSDEDATEVIYYGYDNLDTMFNKLVTQYIDDYTYESTVE